MQLSIDIHYYNNLDIEGFSRMMKDPSYCYKFYWLEAIVQLISENKVEATYDEIIDEMISNAWYSVLEFHIHLKEMAELTNIELKKFDFWNEVQKNAISAIKIMLPDEDVICDPFWVVMEISQDSGENTGNYEMIDNSILLFLSKKQASNYCCKLENAKVFGISQKHLGVLVALQEKGLYPEFKIAFPEFEQLQEGSIFCYSISHERFKKFYLRG